MYTAQADNIRPIDDSNILPIFDGWQLLRNLKNNKPRSGRTEQYPEYTNNNQGSLKMGIRNCVTYTEQTITKAAS